MRTEKCLRPAWNVLRGFRCCGGPADSSPCQAVLCNWGYCRHLAEKWPTFKPFADYVFGGKYKVVWLSRELKLSDVTWHHPQEVYIDLNCSQRLYRTKRSKKQLGHQELTPLFSMIIIFWVPSSIVNWFCLWHQHVGLEGAQYSCPPNHYLPIKVVPRNSGLIKVLKRHWSLSNFSWSLSNPF